jgi:hypothetical protein
MIYQVPCMLYSYYVILGPKLSQRLYQMVGGHNNNYEQTYDVE